MISVRSRPALDEFARPAIVPVARNVWALSFQLMKLVVARHVLARASERDELQPGQPVIESTSGTMGLGLAHAGRERGHPVYLVSDPAVGPELAHKLEVLGARLDVVETTSAGGNYQLARLARLEELRRKTGAFHTQQYDNPDAVDAYADAARVAVASIGSIDWIVSPTGSGANATGLARHTALRQGKPVQLAAVDTPGSVLFGQADAARPFRGLGNSVVPKNLDHELVDEVHFLLVALAQRGANALFRDHAMDVGPTAGAAYLVALDVARRHPNQHVVFVAPDTGERYRRNFLDRGWLVARGFEAGMHTTEPVRVDSVKAATGPWSAFEWNRRALTQGGVA